MEVDEKPVTNPGRWAAAFQVVVGGGVLVFLTGILIGSA